MTASENETALSSTSIAYLGAGLLGATVTEAEGIDTLKEKRLQVIERRIIRIEMALRRAGVEVELVEMPK